MAYTKYSLTPANNNAAPPDGAPEGMLPSAVNDTMRDMMAQIRDVGDGIRGGTYTMTAPVITGGSITGVALSGNTLTSPVITGGSINNTPIGASTANTGAFTTLGATGVATFSAGTVSAPAITTTGDTNTGIFFPAADTIAFTEGGVESMRIDSSGNVLVGQTAQFSNPTKVCVTGSVVGFAARHTSSASGKYFYFGPDQNNSFIFYNQAGTGVYLADGGTSWTANSDERLKTSLIPFSNALEKISSIRAGTGRYLNDDENVSRSFLVAQDVQKVLPEAVNVQNDEIGTLGLSYTDVIPLLVASIKELKAELDSVKAELQTLKGN